MKPFSKTQKHPGFKPYFQDSTLIKFPTNSVLKNQQRCPTFMLAPLIQRFPSQYQSSIYNKHPKNYILYYSDTMG